ncbi:hypothetical protein [Myroides sp. DW712]|uniref:hypothetical protein n=1 Tax=Myroides sp. DW712 TaxID=3389800 RepID=UPI00397E5D51
MKHYKSLLTLGLTLMSFCAVAQVEDKLVYSEDGNLIANSNPNDWYLWTSEKKQNFKLNTKLADKLAKGISHLYIAEHEKKFYNGLIKLEDISMSIDNGEAIPFTNIASDAVYTKITTNRNQNLFLIQNVKTKELYAIHTYPSTFTDYSTKPNSDFIQYQKIEYSASDKEMVNSYKALIKEGDIIANQLVSIQKKHLTLRGYFDDTKLSSADKSSWNSKIDKIKSISDKLKTIYKKDNNSGILSDLLTMSEAGTADNIHNWALKFSHIE